MTSSPAKVPPTFYSYVLAGVGGFNVMLLEMCAFRVLQTEFGSSMYVTGALLSLVMIALSFGYYVGGRASARLPSVGYLLALLGGAAAYVLVVNLMLVGGILDFCFSLRDHLSDPTALNGVPPAVATVALYVLPMLALSQTSPFLVGLLTSGRTAEEGKVGAVAGNLMAISTVGSIAGSLIPSFILIPRVGVVGTLYVLLGTVMLVVLVGAVLIGRAKPAAAFAVVMGLGVFAYSQGHVDSSTRGVRDATVVYSGESPYGNIKILRSQDKDGEETLSYMPSRNYIHTNVYPARPLKEQFTTLHLSLGYARRAKNYLVLGTALGGVVASVVAMDPEARVTAVEIDPAMDGIARRFVPTLNHPHVNLVTADARVFLKETSQTFDYIIVDVFAGQQIPAHCASQEFFALVRARLTADGVAVLNTNLWDFQIGTGLEPKPFVSVHHVHSALLHAGFASLFHNDFLEHGEVYAFNQPTDLATLRGLLGGVIQDEAANVDLRAAAAVAYVGALQVPAERIQERPITDQWVPEHELHLKENFEQFLHGLAVAHARPEWERTQQSDATSLRLISARHYARIVDTGQPNYTGLAQYMKSEGGRQYCDELFAWASVHQGPLDRELARYFHGTVAAYCNEYAQGRAEGSQGEKLLRTYMRAVEKIHHNEGAAALALFKDYLATTELVGREG